MKIQFIICGWWYDEFDGRKGITDFIDGLIELQESNDFIDVFWSCHKEPTKLVKDNFKYKVFENVGLEWGAYNKAFDYFHQSLGGNWHWNTESARKILEQQIENFLEIY